ncbi:hypothetical protein Tco_1568205 [Tanacetum coccineum]
MRGRIGEYIIRELCKKGAEHHQELWEEGAPLGSNGMEDIPSRRALQIIVREHEDGEVLKLPKFPEHEV